MHQLLHVRLLKGFQVCLAAFDELLFMLVPVAFEVSQVLLLLLEEFVHLDVVLGQNLTAALTVLLVAQLFDLGLGFLGVCNEALVRAGGGKGAGTYQGVCLP